MVQIDIFENDPITIRMEVQKLQQQLESLRKGAFYKITELHKELEQLRAHCEVMSDELFSKGQAI